MGMQRLSIKDMAAEIRREMKANPTARGIECSFHFRGNTDAVMVADSLFPSPDWYSHILVDGDTCYIVGLLVDRIDQSQ